MNQTEDLLQGLIEQLENSEAADSVAADLPTEEAEVIQLIAALRQTPPPSTDEATLAAQEAQLLTAVRTQYARNGSTTSGATSATSGLLANLKTWWQNLGSNRELAFGLALLFMIIAVTWLMGSTTPTAEKFASNQLGDKLITTSTDSIVTTPNNSTDTTDSVAVSEGTENSTNSDNNNEAVANNSNNDHNMDDTAVASIPPGNNNNTAFVPLISVSFERNAQTAIIQNISGLVQIQTDGDTWKTINHDSPLLAGQRIRTGDLSQASLIFHDGSQAHLRANTEISLDQLNALRPEDGFRTVVMTQWVGDSDHEVDHRGDGGSLYEVKTPEGSGIARGTKFKVIVSPNQLARYIVAEGKVDVSSFNQTVGVTAGQLTTLLVGSPPTAPTFTITGQGQVTATGSEWTIAGQTFSTHALTFIIGNPQVGDLVHVDGHLLDDGSRVADRIILLRRAVANQFSLTGEVSAMGANWTVAGQTIVTTASTSIDEGILLGDTVRVEGIVLEDGTLQTQTIIRLEAAPGLPFQFSGIVQNMSGGSWIISGRSIAIDENTAVSPNINLGDTVAVTGWILEDDTWLATAINLQEDDLPTFDFTGVINSIDPWVVAGIGFETRDWTSIASGLVIGDEVRVQGTILSDGTWVADSITRLSDTLPNIVTFMGLVSSTDPWIVNGLPLFVTGDTTILGSIIPGMTVIVTAQLLPDGTWTVLSIRPLYPDFGLGCMIFSSPIIVNNNDFIQVKHWHIDIKKDGRIKIHGDLKVNNIVTLPLCTAWNGTIIIFGDIIVIYQPVVIIINNGNNLPPNCRITKKGSIKCSGGGSGSKSKKSS